MTSACSTRPRQRVCQSTRPSDSNRRPVPRHRDPVTSHVTTALGIGRRSRTSSDGLWASISNNPIRYDLARRSHSPLSGYCGPPARACINAASGPLPGAIHVFHEFESLNKGISAGFQVTRDCHFPSHNISKLNTKKIYTTWSPVTESNRRPSPYHACRVRLLASG
jgi:hypothetical protein